MKIKDTKKKRSLPGYYIMKDGKTIQGCFSDFEMAKQAAYALRQCSPGNAYIVITEKLT